MSRGGNVQPRVSLPSVAHVAPGWQNALSAPLLNFTTTMSTEILPNQDERKKIVERARQQLRAARSLAERLNRLEMEMAFSGPQISIHILTPLAQAA